jgi:hypothetical protein
MTINPKKEQNRRGKTEQEVVKETGGKSQHQMGIIPEPPVKVKKIQYYQGSCGHPVHQ